MGSCSTRLRAETRLTVYRSLPSPRAGVELQVDACAPEGREGGCYSYSTSPPRGNQVDGLPREQHRCAEPLESQNLRYFQSKVCLGMQ